MTVSGNANCNPMRGVKITDIAAGKKYSCVLAGSGLPGGVFISRKEADMMYIPMNIRIGTMATGDSTQ
jgi:hypothetical protein